jgi:activator of 2-hydroxyglutaryl-CoA dehydratase
VAGLHEAISKRVLGMLRPVGIVDKFVITGGIAKNIGVVTSARRRAEAGAAEPAPV